MKTFNWSWTKFIIGIALDWVPNYYMVSVPVLAIHIGFLTIIIAPGWDKQKAPTEAGA